MTLIRRVLGTATMFLMLAVAAHGAAQTFSNVSTYTPSSGPVAVSASPGSLYTPSGNGWKDNVGSLWSISSTNFASASLLNSSNDQLSRPASENQIDEQECLTFKSNGQTSSVLEVLLRWNGSTSSMTGYTIGVTGDGTEWAFQARSAGSSAAKTPTGSVPNLTNGTSYVMCGSAVQLNTTQTVLTETISTTSGTLLATATYTDNTSTLQNLSGGYAVIEYTVSSGNQVGISNFSTAKINSGYTVTGPSVAPTNIQTAYSYAANAAISSGSPVTVTPSDGGAGGTFSPSTITLTSSAPGGSFSYSPPGQSSYTLSFTNNGGLTDPSPLTVVGGPPPVSPTSASCSYSPYNWYGLTTRLGGVTYPTAWNLGANFTCTWMASSSPTAQLYFPPSSTVDLVSVNLNGVITNDQAANGPITLTTAMGLAASTMNTVTVQINSFPSGTDPWAGGADVVFQGLILDAASSPGTAPVRQTRGDILLVGDSLTCGYDSVTLNSYEFSAGHANSVVESLKAEGYDVGVSCAGGTGWDIAAGVPAYYFWGANGYVASLSRWNMVDSGVSLLDANTTACPVTTANPTGGCLSAYGATSTTPVAIIIDYLINDLNNGVSTTYLAHSITGAIEALSDAAPNAKILALYSLPVESSQYCISQGCTSIRSSYINAFTNGVGNARVAKASIVDVGQALANEIYQNPSLYLADGYLHPNVRGHLIETSAYMMSIDALLNNSSLYSSGFSNRFEMH